MSNDAEEDIPVHRYKAQCSIDRSGGQGTVFAEKLLGGRYEFDHALGGKAVASARAGSSSWTGGGDGRKGAIGDGFAGGRAMAEDEGVVARNYGNGSMGEIADQESTGLLGRRRLTGPKSGTGIHADAGVCHIGWMGPDVSVSHLVRSGWMTHVLSGQQDNEQHETSRIFGRNRDINWVWKYRGTRQINAGGNMGLSFAGDRAQILRGRMSTSGWVPDALTAQPRSSHWVGFSDDVSKGTCILQPCDTGNSPGQSPIVENKKCGSKHHLVLLPASYHTLRLITTHVVSAKPT